MSASQADVGNRMIRVSTCQLLRSMRPALPGLTGGFDPARLRPPPIWPFEVRGGPHEVAGTFGGLGNPGGNGRDRFHAGVDAHGEDGESLAVRDGRIN
jgi:hypothetical protein